MKPQIQSINYGASSLKSDLDHTKKISNRKGSLSFAQTSDVPPCRKAYTVRQVKPDVHLRLYAVGGLFLKEVLEALKCSTSTRPAIFAMSNPTKNELNVPLRKPSPFWVTTLSLPAEVHSMMLIWEMIKLATATKETICTFSQDIACSVQVPDESITNCTSCSINFTAFVRKHLCRNCGEIFCDKCTQGRTPLTVDDQAQPVRVCDICMEEVTQRLENAKEIASRSGAMRSHEDLAKRLKVPRLTDPTRKCKKLNARLSPFTCRCNFLPLDPRQLNAVFAHRYHQHKESFVHSSDNLYLFRKQKTRWT